MPGSDAVIVIKSRIDELESLLVDLETRLPAHSIPPGLIAAMDDLDEQIQTEKKLLAALVDRTNNTIDHA